ncbi:unnamed protein product [Phytomonas sp. Hart1]|nr:unnamed protein product [Phytomonas sp. Hart1]|eukprot:CCW70808.1 unnamed protein product [Phytomonas sp. isolate Hart1]
MQNKHVTHLIETSRVEVLKDVKWRLMVLVSLFTVLLRSEDDKKRLSKQYYSKIVF